MTLTKKKMVHEIGRRTRLTNREVQDVVESLVDVWTETLVIGDKIEIENFIILEPKQIDRGKQSGKLSSGDAPRIIRRITLRVSKAQKARLQEID